MGNTNAEMAEFAENLWNNFIKPKMQMELANYVSYYRATVASNVDGNVTVSRPFDGTFPVNATEYMANVSVGDNVLVFSLGKGNAANQLIFAYSNGVTPPPEDMGTVKSVTINATSPIEVNSTSPITVSGTRTISHANSGVNAGSYGDPTAQTPAAGGTFKVPYVTVNATGHVTGISDHTVRIPEGAGADFDVLDGNGEN